VKVRAIIFGLLFVSGVAFSFEPLPEAYRVSYGDPMANKRITHYFAFDCPHCVEHFQSTFPKIKSELNGVYYEFHPLPGDLSTIRALHCLEQLTAEEKQIFLEAVMMEISGESQELTVALMKSAMEFFDKPVPNLEERTFISESAAFEVAYKFQLQDGLPRAIPYIETNGRAVKDIVAYLGENK
jgi:hypothetical protein